MTGKALITINDRKRIARVVILAICAYMALIGLLVWAESGQAGATIDSVPAALWYSLVTLTTVGYGDMFPVTLPGKLIGGVFLLLSTGLIAVLISLAVSFIAGGLLPRLRLWRGRKRRWYVFSVENDASRALASNLDDGIPVFCSGDAKRGGRALRLAHSPGRLFALPYIGQGERYFFAMDRDAANNAKMVREIGGAATRSFCCGDGLNGDLPTGALWFSECECVARLYWQTHPWDPKGERVVLLGDGRYGRSLLNYGLLTAPPGCALELLGDWTLWKNVHRELLARPTPGLELRFHEGPWQAGAELLAQADRVILCLDDREGNREARLLLKRYYVTRGSVDALCAGESADGSCFGAPETLFTPELVMRRTQDRLGRQLHELYRRGADYPVPEWTELSEFARQSNLAAADHLLTKLRLLLPEQDVRTITRETCAAAYARYSALTDGERENCRRIEHDRWMLFHALYNWRYAPRRDNARREHPMMVEYERLSEPERKKDENAWEQLDLLSNEDLP